MIAGGSTVKKENRSPNSSSQRAVSKDPKQDLVARVEDAKQRYRNLERRNKLEMEGYENEIMMLKRKLKHLERIYS